jgi:hypothetical protein
MRTLLVKNIELLATFDDQRGEVKDDAIYVRDNVVEAVATSTELESMGG